MSNRKESSRREFTAYVSVPQQEFHSGTKSRIRIIRVSSGYAYFHFKMEPTLKMLEDQPLGRESNLTSIKLVSL